VALGVADPAMEENWKLVVHQLMRNYDLTLSSERRATTEAQNTPRRGPPVWCMNNIMLICKIASCYG
jgi:hypothetical protein